MEVAAGDYLLLVGSGQRQFSFSNVIVGLFRGARVIVVAPDDFHADTVRRIGEARGGTPDLHILDMNDADWPTKVLDLTDGVGPDKIADFTSEEDVLNTELDLVRHDGVLFIQENLRNPNRVLHVDPYAAIAEKNLKIMGHIDPRRIDRFSIIRTLRNKEVQADVGRRRHPRVSDVGGGGSPQDFSQSTVRQDIAVSPPPLNLERRMI